MSIVWVDNILLKHEQFAQLYKHKLEKKSGMKTKLCGSLPLLFWSVVDIHALIEVENRCYRSGLLSTSMLLVHLLLDILSTMQFSVE